MVLTMYSTPCEKDLQRSKKMQGNPSMLSRVLWDMPKTTRALGIILMVWCSRS